MDELLFGISAVFNNPISLIFILIIIFIFITAIGFGLLSRFLSLSVSGRTKSFVGYTPTAMTTIGVIGTFLGIFIGLLGFDVNKIDSSVPSLLSGLKIAFGTSIAGMISAVTFRLLEHSGRIVFGSRPHTSNDQDPMGILAEINDSIQNQTRSFVGDSDSSVLSTLKLTRQENRDGFQKQLTALNGFATQMQEGATKSLIEALKKVIEEFNLKITEQFGDNFKQLNLAVGNLNEWQKEYKSHIEQTQEQLRSQSEAIGKITKELTLITDNISSLAQQAQALPPAAMKMSEANDAILQNFSSMSELLQSMAEIKTNAGRVLPEIEASIKNMTQTMQMSSDEMNSEIKETLSRTHQGINANFKTFDEQMQSELEKTLQEMGTNLTSLSHKFVEDYSPLTDRLRQLVQDLGRAAQ